MSKYKITREEEEDAVRFTKSFFDFLKEYTREVCKALFVRRVNKLEIRRSMRDVDGVYDTDSGVIFLRPQESEGGLIGALDHELAHHVEYSRFGKVSHGSAFNSALEEIRALRDQSGFWLTY